MQQRSEGNTLVMGFGGVGNAVFCENVLSVGFYWEKIFSDENIQTQVSILSSAMIYVPGKWEECMQWIGIMQKQMMHDRLTDPYAHRIGIALLWPILDLGDKCTQVVGSDRIKWRRKKK